MADRAAPFYCPYCSDEGLRPFGEPHGQWRCSACQRVFVLRYSGLAPGVEPAVDTEATGSEPRQELS